MLYLIIGLFALTAVIGIIILKNWLTASTTSRGVIYAHGIFAAAALVLLLLQVLEKHIKSAQGGNDKKCEACPRASFRVWQNLKE